MPRIPREHRQGERHHITNRASLKRPAFIDDHDRGFFLWILREFNTRFEVEVEAFCLMNTHYHLVLACSLDEMAKALHRLGFLYTQYFNDRHDVDGPLFSDRFYSNPILDERYHRNAVRYVHRNPLAIDKLMDLGRYRWSSHGAYLGLRPLDFLKPDSTLALFGGSRKIFRDFVENPVNDINQPSITDVVHVVGVATASLPQATAAERAQLQRVRSRLVSLIAAEHLGRTSAETASELLLSSSAVRGQLSRARPLLRSDAFFAHMYNEAIDKLGPVDEVPSWWKESWDT